MRILLKHMHPVCKRITYKKCLRAACFLYHFLYHLSVHRANLFNTTALREQGAPTLFLYSSFVLSMSTTGRMCFMKYTVISVYWGSWVVAVLDVSRIAVNIKPSLVQKERFILLSVWIPSVRSTDRKCVMSYFQTYAVGTRSVYAFQSCVPPSGHHYTDTG